MAHVIWCYCVCFHVMFPDVHDWKGLSSRTLKAFQTSATEYFFFYAITSLLTVGIISTSTPLCRLCYSDTPSQNVHLYVVHAVRDKSTHHNCLVVPLCLKNGSHASTPKKENVSGPTPFLFLLYLLNCASLVVIYLSYCLHGAKNEQALLIVHNSQVNSSKSSILLLRRVELKWLVDSSISQSTES